MKLLIITGIFPPDIGGPATYVSRIVEALSNRGHEVIVVTLSDDVSTVLNYPFRVVRLQRACLKSFRFLRTIFTLRSPVQAPLPTPVNVVTVASLVPWEQVDKIIAALGDCDDTGLVVIDDGPERSHLEMVVRDLNLDTRIFFAGQKSKLESLSLVEYVIPSY